MESDCSRLQQELQDSRDQNELLEFRILELEVSSVNLNLFSRLMLVKCKTSLIINVLRFNVTTTDSRKLLLLSKKKQVK